MNENVCPICLYRVVSYKTKCGHSYCFKCLFNINKCALCRQEFKSTKDFVSLLSNKQQKRLTNVKKMSRYSYWNSV
jgi:hypothetical protein